MENTPSTNRNTFRFLALLVMVALLWPFTSVSAAAPSNDDFNSPLIISAIPYTHSQSIGEATKVLDDPPLSPCISKDKGYNTVWYQFTPSSSGLFTIDTINSDYDTVLGVWTGSRGSLISHGCNDDGVLSGSGQSRLQLHVDIGQVYYIEVASWDQTASGNLVFHASWFGKNSPVDNITYMSINPTLHWTPSLDIIYYDVCVDQVANSTCESSWTDVGTNTSYTKIGLNFGQKYYWQVRAHTSSGTVDADSNIWWSFTTGFGKDNPSAGAVMQPFNLQLIWYPYPGATSYQYCIDESDNNTCNNSWIPTNNLYANISGLTMGHTYYWQVRAAINPTPVEANDGAWWSFTTLVYKVYLPLLTK